MEGVPFILCKGYSSYYIHTTPYSRPEAIGQASIQGVCSSPGREAGQAGGYVGSPPRGVGVPGLGWFSRYPLPPTPLPTRGVWRKKRGPETSRGYIR